MYRFWVFVHLVGVVGFLVTHGVSMWIVACREYAEDPVFRTRFRQEIEAVRKVSGAFTASAQIS